MAEENPVTHDALEDAAAAEPDTEAPIDAAAVDTDEAPLESPPESPGAEEAAGATPEAPPEAEPTPAPRPLRAPARPDAGGFVWGTGRRKTAIARVRVRPAADPANAQFKLNRGREVNDFFTEVRDQEIVRTPLKVTQTEGKVDIFVNVSGGGYSGQAVAVSLGLSRALLGYDPSLEPILRDHDLLTRDPRKVERKKPGQPGARKKFQFSKR